MTSTFIKHSDLQFWRSPLHQIENQCLTDDEKKESIEEVQVPSSGLYGFIFGSKMHRQDFVTMQRGSDQKCGSSDVVHHCGCAFRAFFSVPGYNDSNESNSLLLPLTSPTLEKKLLTSTRVAQSMYLPKGTTIHVKQSTSCEAGDKCQWVWGLLLQQNFDLFKKNFKEGQPMKKAKKEASSSNHEETISNKFESFDYQKVHFEPSQCAKKPVICTKCCRKFSNIRAIRNHYLSGHAPKLGDLGNESEDDYRDLVGPKIFRTPLKTAYDDNDLVIVVKPQGVPVQGSKWTLPKSDLLMPFRSKLNREGDLSKPRIAHRLDSPTGGLLVVAKSAEAERNIKRSFEMRLCKKRYRAIVFGKIVQNQHQYSDLLDDENVDHAYFGMGIINVALSGKASTTRYRVVDYTKCNHPMANGFITTVDLYPVTGRRHQLRKHLKLIGHPIWGDFRYAMYSKTERIANQGSDVVDGLTSVEQNPHSRLCLWALEISLPHPCKNEFVTASIEEPAWYEQLRHAIAKSSNIIL